MTLHIRKNTQKSKFLLSQAFKWEKNMFFVIPEMLSKIFIMGWKKLPDHFRFSRIWNFGSISISISILTFTGIRSNQFSACSPRLPEGNASYASGPAPFTSSTSDARDPGYEVMPGERKVIIWFFFYLFLCGLILSVPLYPSLSVAGPLSPSRTLLLPLDLSTDISTALGSKKTL